MNGIVIVGAGLAGVQAAEALRGAGWSGPLTILGAEAAAPYHRPPLSKAWLAGEASDAQIVLRTPEALARKQIALRTSCRVRALDLAGRWVRLDGGESLAYDGLVLATGMRPRKLEVPGAEAPNVLGLRTRDDAARLAAALRACLAERRPLTVVGGGFIGLEVAATARKLGLDVVVLEALPRLLARALSPRMSAWVLRLHESKGVAVETGATVRSLATDAGGQAVAVELADGRRYDTGLVLVGIGSVPNDELAQEAGLACDRGIVVDACARTSAAAVVAAGDCTARRLPDGSLLRLESVHNATEQAKSAAAALMGQERPFTGTPWFWSDQYDRKIQMAGQSTGGDASAVRGDENADAFSVWHYRGGRLVGVDTVNNSRDHLLARRLLDAGITPSPSQVEDSQFDLATLLPAGPAVQPARS